MRKKIQCLKYIRKKISCIKSSPNLPFGCVAEVPGTSSKYYNPICVICVAIQYNFLCLILVSAQGSRFKCLTWVKIEHCVTPLCYGLCRNTVCVSFSRMFYPLWWQRWFTSLLHGSFCNKWYYHMAVRKNMFTVEQAMKYFFQDSDSDNEVHHSLLDREELWQLLDCAFLLQLLSVL